MCDKQSFVKLAGDDLPVHIAVGNTLRSACDLASLRPLAYQRRLESYSGVGERLGDVRRSALLGIIPAEFLQTSQFHGLHSLFGAADGACDPLVCLSCG